ncbi:MAG: hypothetical protein U9Q77_03405 [Candidatus Marinimicrobia bacterium]|nr:hypothetical protein [Candidatus Neomarinimicrobiota bacterium]
MIRFLLAGQFITGSISLFSQEIYYDLSNSTGAADFLLGSRLVENAAYGSSMLTVSSVLSDNSRAYLDISHSQIFPFTEYSSSQGEFGLQLRYLEIKNNQLFAGLQTFVNRYHENYSYYNSSGYGLYLKWKYYFKAGHLITSGYDLTLKKYSEVAEASNSEHSVYAAYNQSFKTKTSLYLRSSFAIQDFWSQSTVTGRGRHIRTVAVSDIPSNNLVTSEIRLSQSLGPRIGLTLWLESQSLLNESADLLRLQDGLDNPFTDRFRWEGPSAALRVLYRFNSNNSLKITHSYLKRSYLDVPVYLFDFQTMDYDQINEELVNLGYDREDERNSLQLNWSKNWMLTRFSWLADLELDLGLGWTQNRSNDPLYDYQSLSYNIGINLNN